MQTISLTTVISSIRAKVDGSLGLTMSTPELSSTEKATVMELQGAALTTLIKPLDEAPKEVMRVEKNLETKSQAQIIRSIIYKLWKQSGEDGDFEAFYRQKTGKYIEFLLSKLD
jgi:hypothetical protein